MINLLNIMSDWIDQLKSLTNEVTRLKEKDTVSQSEIQRLQQSVVTLEKVNLIFVFFNLSLVVGALEHSVFQAKTNIDLELQTYKSRLVQEETAHKEAVKQLESQMHLAREESNLHQIKGETGSILNQLFRLEQESRTAFILQPR